MRRGTGVLAGRAIRLALIYAALVALFAIALVAVYTIPQSSILQHVRTSAALLRAEGPYPRPVLDDASYQLDGYTDALMLDTAVASEGDSPLIAAVAVRHGGGSGLDATIDGLERTASGDTAGRADYAYYWHGYLVVLRPLLALFDYGDLRYLNLMALGALLVATLLRTARKAGAVAASAFAAALMVAGVYVVPLSLQFSSVFYVALIASLVALGLHDAGRDASRDVELFFVVGMVTAFVDLLTAPLLTLGLPLMLLLALDARDGSFDSGGLAALRRVMRTACAWAIGFAASWAAKWVIATIVLRVDVVGRALSQTAYRAGAGRGAGQLSPALYKPVADLLPLLRIVGLRGSTAGALLVGTLLTVAAIAIGVWLRLRKPWTEISRLLPVLLVVPLPYAWFALASNHTAIHHWFAYRTQAPAVFAVLYVVAMSVDPVKVRAMMARRRTRGVADAEGESDA